MPVNEKVQISRESVVDVKEFTEMVHRLPEKERERLYFMMKGIELVSDRTPQDKRGERRAV